MGNTPKNFKDFWGKRQPFQTDLTTDISQCSAGCHVSSKNRTQFFSAIWFSKTLNNIFWQKYLLYSNFKTVFLAYTFTYHNGKVYYLLSPALQVK